MYGELNAGDIVIATRNIRPDNSYKKFSFSLENYPTIGMAGILTSVFQDDINQKNKKWVIEWYDEAERISGDLVYDWMIEKLEKEWDD